MMRHMQYPALALRTTVAAALLATASLSHAEGSDIPDPVPVASSDSPVRAVFSADHPRFGREPWITDGTREGTQLLRDIARGTPTHPPHPNSSSPQYFSDLGDGRVAFTASHRTRDGQVSREPYITDGTRAGTGLVRRIGEISTGPRDYTTLGDGRFVFTGRNPQRSWAPCVWASDGTRASTFPVVCSNWHSHLPNGFTPLREGQVVFSMNDGRRGWEPWITDGTRDGTQIVTNLTGDDRSSYPQEIVQLAEGLVLFTATAEMRRELWVSDGTRRGTRQLTEIPSSTVDNRPKHITPIGGGKALFSANFELWITDGTLAGTHLLPDERTRVIPIAPSDFTALGDGRALFTARSDYRNQQLWITNGTARGTRIVREVEPDWRPQYLRSLGDGRAIFWQWQPAPLSHYALWVTDGTRRGTSRVQQFPNMTVATEPRMAQASSMGNGLVLFTYDNGRTGWEPWVSDGTRQGTGLLRNISRTQGSMTWTSGVSFTPFIPAQPD